MNWRKMLALLMTLAMATTSAGCFKTSQREADRKAAEFYRMAPDRAPLHGNTLGHDGPDF